MNILLQICHWLESKWWWQVLWILISLFMLLLVIPIHIVTHPHDYQALFFDFLMGLLYVFLLTTSYKSLRSMMK